MKRRSPGAYTFNPGIKETIVPHAWIEYSANIQQEPEVQALKQTLRDAIVEAGIFPLAGVRIRAAAIDDYLVADDDPENAFVHVALRVGAGRDEATRKKAADGIFARITAALARLSAAGPLAIAFEVQEMDKLLNYKANNLHDYLKRRAAA